MKKNIFGFSFIVSTLIATTAYSGFQEVNVTGITRVKAYKVRNGETKQDENVSILSSLQENSTTNFIPSKPSCQEAPEYGGGVPFPTTVMPLGGSFFPIQGRAEWLPPEPGSAGKNTIEGIDADGDCVRDDIEYFIARKYPNSNQKNARKYLQEYSIWISQFLLSGITRDDAKYYSRKMYMSVECARRELGETSTTQKNIDKTFAEHLNTMDRSYRYISNNALLGGATKSELMSVIICDPSGFLIIPK